jgi:nitrate/TMAO reductase-like tetraheme cytochrome c subunit
MRSPARIGWAALIAAIGLATAASTPHGRPDAEPPPCPPTTAGPEDCGRCHPAVLEEWSDSAHAKAFVAPVYQRQLKQRRNPGHCKPCHAPDSVLAKLGSMPEARMQEPEHGVTCASCHVADGVVHGPNGPTLAEGDRPARMHQTQKNAAFGKRGSFVLCSSCHDMAIADVLPLAREFRAAGLQDEDLSCIGCHMAAKTRAPAVDPTTKAPIGGERRGRSHRLLGPMDPEFCATAFEIDVAREGNTVVALLGTGAGHGVPGLARLRWFDIQFLLVDSKSREVTRKNLRISWEDRLMVDEVRRIVLPKANGAVALRVLVDHVFDGQFIATVLDREIKLS